MFSLWRFIFSCSAKEPVLYCHNASALKVWVCIVHENLTFAKALPCCSCRTAFSFFPLSLKINLWSSPYTLLAIWKFMPIPSYKTPPPNSVFWFSLITPRKDEVKMLARLFHCWCVGFFYSWWGGGSELLSSRTRGLGLAYVQIIHLGPGTLSSESTQNFSSSCRERFTEVLHSWTIYREVNGRVWKSQGPDPHIGNSVLLDQKASCCIKHYDERKPACCENKNYDPKGGGHSDFNVSLMTSITISAHFKLLFLSFMSDEGNHDKWVRQENNSVTDCKHQQSKNIFWKGWWNNGA